MKKIQYILMVAAGLWLGGCQEEEKWGTGDKTGFLISLDDVSVEVTTRAASEEFNLVVTKDGITEPVKETTLTTGSSTFVEVSAGTYNIKATSKDEINGVDWDPYYVANATEEITEEDTQKTISLTARYGCALVSVNFPEGLTDIFKEYYVEVNAVGKSSLKLTSSKQKAYVEAGEKVSLSFGGTKLNGDKVENKPLTHKDLPETFDAADYYKITLMMGDGLTMDISKVEEKTVEITEDIPLDWLPKPKMEAEGFDDNNNLNFVETETKTAKLGLDLSSELQDIKFKFAFQDEQFTESLQKDKEYLLSNAEDKAAIEKALGVTLPNVGDETGNIDFSALVAKMQTNAGTPTINSVEVDVKANNRWSSEVKEGDDAPNLKYTFTCNKPEFSVAVQPGNCWAWQFTADEVKISGNADAEKLKSNLVYQYYDGSNWQNFSDGLTQKFAKDENRKYIYNDAAASKRTYKVRALYRGAVASAEVDATLEEPWQVPNGNMDAWTSTTRITEYTLLWETYTSERPYYQPWYNDVKQWWDTNNNKTIPTSVSATLAYIDYKSFPTTTFETPGYNNSDKAAVIRSVAVDDWNSDAQGKGSTKGVLYAGVTNNNGGMTEGQNWNSRPSIMTFMYKYDSQDNERFGAYIELLAEDGTSIASGNFMSVNGQSVTSYAKAEVALTYSNILLKAATIKIRFVSVADGESSVYTGKQNVTIPAGNYQIYGGSVLTIDDISLIYDK